MSTATDVVAQRPLANTGSPIIQVAKVGGAIVAAGVALLLASFYRRKHGAHE